jgi:hypothetical protein
MLDADNTLVHTTHLENCWDKKQERLTCSDGDVLTLEPIIREFMRFGSGARLQLRLAAPSARTRHQLKSTTSKS